MKTLRESLFDQDITSNELDDAIIQDWLKSTYTNRGEFIIDYDNKIINSTDNVDVSHSNLSRITRLLPEGWKFGDVRGYFNCSHCRKLESLEGAPESVLGTFTCRGCISLKSLEGAPRSCYEFDCSLCDKIMNLEGAPDKACIFNCSQCQSLDSLEGAPDVITGSFACRECPGLESLEGAPKTVKGSFACSKCYNLKSLDHIPSTIGRDLYCMDCPIENYSILDKIKIGGQVRLV